MLDVPQLRHSGVLRRSGRSSYQQIVELLARADQAFMEADEAMRTGDLVTWAQKIEEAQAAVEEATRLLMAANEVAPDAAAGEAGDTGDTSTDA